MKGAIKKENFVRKIKDKRSRELVRNMVVTPDSGMLEYKICVRYIVHPEAFTQLPFETISEGMMSALSSDFARRFEELKKLAGPK